MGKQILIIIVASIFIVYFGAEISVLIKFIASWQAALSDKIISVLPWSGRVKTGEICALIVFPMVITFIPSFLYWLVGKNEMPHASKLLWFVWMLSAFIFLTNS